MRHVLKTELQGSTALTLKDGGEGDPNDVVTKALADLTKTMEDRLSEIEGKADTSKLSERLDKIEAKSNRAKGEGEEDKDAKAEAEKKAFAAYLRRGDAVADEDRKAMTTADDEQGGYLAPTETSMEFVRDLVETSPIRAFASVRTITSPSVKYPKRTGISNAQWEDEAEESEESTVPFGQLEVPARKLMTHVDVSNELLTDSGGVAETEVRLALAEDFGQKEGVSFVNGSGIKQPEGLLVNPDIQQHVNGSETVLSLDELIKLMYELPAMYRNRATWMMNGTTLGIVRAIKDADGRYIWQPSLQAGQPETILGRPVVEAVDMPDIASGETPILFGDFEGYRIVDRLAMSILVNPYVLATKGLTRIHATRRVGGRVLQAARFRKLIMST